MYNDIYNTYDPYAEQGYFNPILREQLDKEITLNMLPFNRLNAWERQQMSPYERMGLEAQGLNNIGLGSMMTYPHRAIYSDIQYGPGSADKLEGAIEDFRRPDLVEDKFAAMRTHFNEVDPSDELRKYIYQTALMDNEKYRGSRQLQDKFLRLFK